MTSELALRKTEFTSSSVISELRRHGWTLKAGSAAFGLYGGVIAALFGSILYAIAWLTGSSWHGYFLQRSSTILLFLTIPLLILGAHCLDLLDRQDDNDNEGKGTKAGSK